MYACYLEGADHALLRIAEISAVSAYCPDRSEVRVVIFEAGGRRIEGAGRANAAVIDAAAQDALQGQIDLKRETQGGMKGSINMLGHAKSVECLLIYQGKSVPEAAE